MWLPAHAMSVVEIDPSPHHCFRTAHSCEQSGMGSPTESVLSRSSRQRLGHLQSHFDGCWHVCQAVFPEPQSAAACRRVERHFCLLSASDFADINYANVRMENKSDTAKAILDVDLHLSGNCTDQ